MFMNEGEIDHAAETLKGTAGRYARHLRAYKEIVNANSDGWAYWRAGYKAGAKLGALVAIAMDVAREWKPAAAMPDEAAFKAACRPIKAACTRHRLPACTLGETD